MTGVRSAAVFHAAGVSAVRIMTRWIPATLTVSIRNRNALFRTIRFVTASISSPLIFVSRDVCGNEAKNVTQVTIDSGNDKDTVFQAGIGGKFFTRQLYKSVEVMSFSEVLLISIVYSEDHPMKLSFQQPCFQCNTGEYSAHLRRLFLRFRLHQPL